MLGGEEAGLAREGPSELCLRRVSSGRYTGRCFLFRFGLTSSAWLACTRGVTRGSRCFGRRGGEGVTGSAVGSNCWMLSSHLQHGFSEILVTPRGTGLLARYVRGSAGPAVAPTRRNVSLCRGRGPYTNAHCSPLKQRAVSAGLLRFGGGGGFPSGKRGEEKGQ